MLITIRTPYRAGSLSKDLRRMGCAETSCRRWTGIGEIMKVLEETGVADNTLVIFTSDNGPVKEYHARPYRGTKYVTLKAGIGFHSFFIGRHASVHLRFWTCRLTQWICSQR